MTRVELDRQTGRLRLDREAFERLVGAATSATAAEECAEDAVAEGARHPKVKAGLEAVLEPSCRLRITMSDGERHVEHEGRLTPSAAALLLTSPDGLLEFLTMAPEFVPAVLARLLRLGPRSVAERSPVGVREDALDGLVDPDPVARGEAFATVADTGASLAAKVELVWDGRGDEPDGRGLVVLDGQGGLYAFRLSENGGELVPVDGTFVWTAFCALLPDDATLAGCRSSSSPSPWQRWSGGWCDRALRSCSTRRVSPTPRALLPPAGSLGPR
jgi:hypothetical protein